MYMCMLSQSLTQTCLTGIIFLAELSKRPAFCSEPHFYVGLLCQALVQTSLSESVMKSGYEYTGLLEPRERRLFYPGHCKLHCKYTLNIAEKKGSKVSLQNFLEKLSDYQDFHYGSLNQALMPELHVSLVST